MNFPQPGIAIEQPQVRDGIGFKSVMSLILGIISLVCCCVPFIGVLTGPLAALFGGLALRQHEPSGGKGIAIGGLVTGLLGTLAGIVVLLGGLAIIQQISVVASRPAQAILAAQDGDVKPMQSAVVPSKDAITEDEIRAFSQRVTDKLGRFKSLDTGIVSIGMGTARFQEVDEALAKKLAAVTPAVGFRAEFDNGRAVFLILMPAGSGATGQLPAPVNIGVFQEGSTEIIWLRAP
jgi:hypothetical protein